MMTVVLCRWALITIWCIILISNVVCGQNTADWMSGNHGVGFRIPGVVNMVPSTTLATAMPQYKLSTPNSNDCTGAGADYVIVTNEADCADANGALSLAEYKGAIIDSATPLGCISSSEGVFFNYDPIGSTTSNEDAPICKYLTAGTIVPPEYYKLSQANTEDCSTAGVDYIPIEDAAECQSAASEGFLGADFLYTGLCDINFYPDGCFLTDLSNIYYGNMTDGNASPKASPICKFSAKPSTMPSDFPSLEESANPSSEPSDLPSRLPSSTPSLSAMPSISPSLEESANPSDEPSDHPTQSPTASPEPPTKSPIKSPVKSPIKSPVKSPIKKPIKSPPPPTTKSPIKSPPPPTTMSPVQAPTIPVTKNPTQSPLHDTLSPTYPEPTFSPTNQRSPVIETKCSIVSPLDGVTTADLQNNFLVVVVVLEDAMRTSLGSVASGWTTSVLRVGDVNTRRLSRFQLVDINMEDAVDVEYEFTNRQTCSSPEGCTEEEQSSSLHNALDLLDDVVKVVTNGELTQLLRNEADKAGLNILSDATFEEVEVVAPEVEIIEISAFPSVAKTSSPTLSPNPSMVVTTVPTPQTTTAAPSSTSDSCSDSPFRFDVLKGNKIIRRACWWVANKPNERCSHEGISSHCLKTCSSCESCVNSPFKFEVTHKGKIRLRSCAWVGRKAVGKRCSIDGISDTCQLACGSCTSPPTVAPSCNDSFYRFDVLINKEVKRKSCAWVANHPIKKCKLEGISSHCPQTCSSCDVCTDSLLKFKITLNNGDESLRSCKWAGRKNVGKRCRLSDITNTCRLTCGGC